MNQFHTKRVELANAMAAAGRALLEHTSTSAALAAIPNTDPQQYVVAGTLPMIAKVLPAEPEVRATQAATAAPVQANEEILALHRQLAAERLRADQGWARAEAKSKECIELRERMAAPSLHLSEQEVRDQVLADAEEAAEAVMRAADDNSESAEGIGAFRCVNAIRALKSPGTAQPSKLGNQAATGGSDA